MGVNQIDYTHFFVIMRDSYDLRKRVSFFKF